MKITYKLSPAILLLILLCAQSHAFTIQLKPKEAAPGGIFLLNVQASGDNSLKAEFAGKTIALYQSDNKFVALIPVSIDSAPGEYPVTIISGEEKKTVHIRIKAFRFPTKKMTLPEEKVILKPEDQERANREAELLNSIWPLNTQRTWNGRFTKPVRTTISEVFGVNRIMNGKKTSVHQGVDFKGSTGTPVTAINSGTVVLTGDLFFGGNTVVVDHGMGLYSMYMHLSEFKVSKGDPVSKAQLVGLVGSTGRATGPHLHFGVKLHGMSVNPEALFDLKL